MNLQNIQARRNDSAIWKETLRHKKLTAECMDCGEDYTFNWRGIDSNLSLNNVWKMIRSKGQSDPLARGVWASKIPKIANFMWKLRWQKLPTADRLLAR